MADQTEKLRRAAMDELFSPERYKKNEVGGKEFFFADGSDAMGNMDFVVLFTHVPSGEVIKFKAFITAFNDTYSQDWGGEQVYGRADPLYNFKQTTRKISIGFKMPAASEGEAYENLTKAQRLSQFMYPNYTALKGGARTVSQGPLLRLKVMNLLQTNAATTRKDGLSEKTLYENYGASGLGMLGFCSDVTFNFNLEGEHGVFQKQNGTILPKLIEVSIGSFSPIHEHHLGWDANRKFSTGQGELFPYGAQHTSTEDPEGSSYSDLQRAKDEKARAEAAIANAEARYGGMFGDARQRKDERKMRKGKYSDSKREYIASALGGQAAIEEGYMKDGNLDSSEVSAINTISDLYDGYVED
tara:strand:- start:254 stop:1324 length:1071 start_codon:yes stop_codon:yes gene_type:complete